MEKTSNRKTVVLVLGVFDLIHDGHKHFLSEAKKLGDRLIVAVAPDKVVKILKRGSPRNNLQQRISNLKKLGMANEVVSGDEKIGSWEILKNKKPDIIALGYDQSTLAEELKILIDADYLPITCTTLKPFKGDTLHSSQLKLKNL